MANRSLDTNTLSRESARGCKTNERNRRFTEKVSLAVALAMALVAFPWRTCQAGLYDTTLTSLPGLISHWNLNETSGFSAADSVTGDSVDGNNAGSFIGSGITLGTPGPRPADGWTGFDANNFAPEFTKTPDQKLEMFNVGGYTGLTDLTMLGWMNIADPDFNTNSNMFGGLQKDTGARYNFAINSYPGNATGGFVSRDDDGTLTQLNVGQAPSAKGINEWRFIAMTFESGTTAKFYVDGVEIDSDIGNDSLGLFAPVAMVFANDIGDNNRALEGKLDELAMFNRALTATEVGNLFTAAGGTLPGAPGTTATQPFLPTAANLGGMRNHWSFAETAGTSAADEVAANNGTITNVLGSPFSLAAAGPDPTNSHDGFALVGLPANNSAVQFANSAINYMSAADGQVLGAPSTGDAFADGINELTMSLWFKHDSAAQGYVAGFSENTTESGRYVFTTISGDDQNVTFYVKSDNNEQLVTHAIEIDELGADPEWHHLVQVWDGSETRMRVYVDGQLKYNNTNDAMTENLAIPDDFFVGYDLHGFTRNLGGLVDEVMLFDRALTGEEAFELYDSAFVAGALPGDFNNDGVVDGSDLSDPVDGWKTRYGAAVDGLDGSDFLTWQRNLSGAPSEVGAAAIPEPSAIVLMLSSVVGIALCTRRMSEFG